MINRILTYSFYVLFAITPLLFAPWNFELFEYNKMMFVYLLTIIITTFWLLKMVQEKSLIFKRTPLDIPFLIFLIANILSTIFSIDPHTSIWGYYSRLNGGLLSIITYYILYYALVSNLKGKEALNLLKAGIFGGVIVALYAIPEHFGISPSCILLSGQANANCWVQDVQARVFATLGQPNWLAGYLGMLIFPTIYFALTAKSKLSQTTYYLLLTTYYLAFTFTYSRGATLGLFAGIMIFAGFIFWQKSKLSHLSNLSLLSILGIFLFINLIFGSALTGDFKLFSKFAPPARPVLTTTLPSSGTQLENGGTESGAIRLIVWQGALGIFKAYPIFGSGVETFAYSYYQFRPQAHNLVSEWDFLYNKAHNEFLNYLATTGIVGFASYMFLIVTFIIWSAKRIMNQESSLKENMLNSYSLILITLLASYISYLVTNFFGFSVVITALFFFLFPALAFIYADSVKSLKELRLPRLLLVFPRITEAIIFILAILLIYKLGSYYVSDTYFAKGYHASEAGNPGRAFNQLTNAVNLNPKEPYYQSELAFAAASAALALEKEDASTSAELKNEAITLSEKVLKNHPQNVSYFRTAIRTYYMLSALDPEYNQKTLDILDQTIKLAPTDVKLIYNKGVILSRMNKTAEAIIELQKAINLKPNYLEAINTLKQLQENK